MHDVVGSTALAVIAPKVNHVLIDHENVQPTGLKLLDRQDMRVWIFVGASQTKISSELAITAQQMGERARYVRISGNGANALDFHIAYYLGKLVSQTPDAYFHVISKDTGYDPLIEHLRANKAKVYRAAAIEQMALFPQKPAPKPQPASAKPAAPKSSAASAAKLTVTVEPKAGAAATAKAPASAPPTPSKAAMNSAQRLAHMKDNLARHKNARPGKAATLRNHVQAQFQKVVTSEQVDELIASLCKAGVIRLEGDKVIYR